MNLIYLERLTRSYGQNLALEAQALSLPPGAVGLLGPNGAGKSTLLKILMGLLPPSSGHAEVLGFNVVSQSLEIRARVGYVSEEASFVPGLTAVEFVTLAGEVAGMPRRDAHRRAHEMLAYLGVEESRYRPVDGLSTGVKQRIQLAQALVHDPALLILDEPTNGLDPAGRKTMLDLLSSLHRHFGKSLILSSHLLDDVDRICDSVIVLDRGRVLAHGRIDLLRAHLKNRYRLRVQGDASRFRALLLSAGATIKWESRPGGAEENEILVEVPAGFSSRRFFELIEEAHRGVVSSPGGLSGGAPLGGRDSLEGQHALLRGLLPDEEKLTDLFQRIVESGEASVVR
jgi:ABC-2 type transport system ATP-binding protein